MESTTNLVIGTIAETFSIDPATLTRETTALEVSGWDSFGHVQLVLAIEDKLGTPLEVSDTLDLANVGQLIDFVEAARA